MKLKEFINRNKQLKLFLLFLLMPKNQSRPRWWVKCFINPFFHKKGKHVLIRFRTRLDVLPFNKFVIADDSTIEDFSTINNGVGNVFIGKRTRIGIGSVLIGPVIIGNDVRLAQNVVVSGLNHGYEDVNIPISKQKVKTKQVKIEDESWIGANSVILPGITVGFHAVVAAGSVVTKDVPPFSVVAGNPAKIKKQYNSATKQWINI
jgi:acetyltransferase-like isoleucine patch superfamily enzyme